MKIKYGIKYKELYCEYLKEENEEQLTNQNLYINLHVIDSRKELVILTSCMYIL